MPQPCWQMPRISGRSISSVCRRQVTGALALLAERHDVDRIVADPGAGVRRHDLHDCTWCGERHGWPLGRAW